jgi:tetratricopeptide (TPR) repeat protein
MARALRPLAAVPTAHAQRKGTVLARPLVTVLIALAITTGAARARGDKRPTVVERKLAHRFFEVASAYYQQADYEKAIEYFRKSYRLSREPALLFNIGRCEEGLGRLDAAVTSYKRFLALTGRDRPMIRARIQNLERRLKSGKRHASTAPGPLKQPTTKTNADKTNTKLAVTPTRPDTGSGTTPATPAQPDQPRDTGGRRTWSWWAGWIIAGAGVAAIGASIALGAAAASKASAVEGYYADGNRDWAQVKSLDDSGNSLEVGQIVTLVGGLVLGAGGAALLLFLPRQEASSVNSASVAPLLGNGRYGVAYHVRF